METGIHNTSEIGRLRKVLLHRPGQELENLMPEYLERLLFDDIPYLREAQREHDAFADCLRGQGVEVVYLSDLVAESITDGEVRRDLLRQFLDEADLRSPRLRESLDKMGVEVEVLTEQVAEQNARAENLSSEKVELENQLHTVYYIVGVEKELRDAQIIDKQGFIGRTLTVNNTNNLESFTKADSRLLSEIPVGRKKVTVVTAQPEDSYQLVTGGEKDKIVTKLLITDPVRFWESSKILIISYK